MNFFNEIICNINNIKEFAYLDLGPDKKAVFKQ